MGHQDASHVDASRPRQGRQVVSVADLAARLEHRLHGPHIDDRALVAGCAVAVDSGLAAVLCRPEQVALAAAQVAGSELQVVTALGFHEPASPLRQPADLAREAQDLIGQGASDVALIAAPGGLPSSSVDLLVDQVAVVAETVGRHAGRVRVLLDTTAMTDTEISSCCTRVALAGAWLVQGGTFRGDRTGFSRIELMRAALPPPVLLKWTHPLSTVETMLVCIGLGVDRFNGDPGALLAAAKRSAATAPLTVPKPGLDF